MDVLKRQLRPKLEHLGSDLSIYLTEILGRRMYPHVAKHARRTVNPPMDSWVALVADKRGYKKHPHFEVGLWDTHMYAQFCVIAECPERSQISNSWLHHLSAVQAQVPEDFFWWIDHTQHQGVKASNLSREELAEFIQRMGTSRSGELLVGLQMEREIAIQQTPAMVMERIRGCLATLAPLYLLAVQAEGVET